MKIGIVLKLVVLAVFLAGICGGMYLAYIAAENGEWAKLAAGIISASLAALVIGTLVPWIAHFDGSAHWEADEGSVNIVGSIKVGLLAMLVMSGMLFTVFGIWVWVEYGQWIAGVASIVWFAAILCGCVAVSIRHQTRHSRAIAKDPDATEAIATVTASKGEFGYTVLGKSKFFVKTFIIELDGVKYTAAMRKSSKLCKTIVEGCEVRIKYYPARPKYCAIIERV